MSGTTTLPEVTVTAQSPDSSQPAASQPAIDFRLRYEDHREAIRSALDSRQASIWTALPGIIQSFDAGSITAVVQPALQSVYVGPDRKIQLVTINPLPDVPVVFPRGGGYELTFPIKNGDECLLVFSSRCIDQWWDQGGVQPQRELRSHDINDGFALVGPWSQKTKIQNVSTTTTQLRTDDGTIYVEIDSSNKRIRLVSSGLLIEVDNSNNQINITGADNVTVQANSQVTIGAPTVVINGNLHVSGAVIGGFGTGDQVGLQTHRHGLGNPSAGTVPPSAGT